MEFSLKLGAVKQHQQLATAPTSLNFSPSVHPGPSKGNAYSDNAVVMEDSGSMGDQDGDSVVGVIENGGDQDDDESDSETDSQESITNSSWTITQHAWTSKMQYQSLPIRSSAKKVLASCSPTKQGLSKNAQLQQIRNNCNRMWGSNYEAIKTEWDLAFEKDPSSFKVSRMIVCTDLLLQIKAAANARNIYAWEHETNIDRRKKALVWSLKQFHTCYYQLYEKGTTHAMVGLQDLHLGNALRCSNISSGIGLKLYCPCCLNLGGNMEAFAIHLWKVHH